MNTAWEIPGTKSFGQDSSTWVNVQAPLVLLRFLFSVAQNYSRDMFTFLLGLMRCISIHKMLLKFNKIHISRMPILETMYVTS